MKLTNKEGYNIKDTTYFQSFKSKQYSGHKKIPTSVAWNKQGTMLASAENVIKIWGHHGQYSLQKLHEIKGHDSLIDSLKFSTDNLLGSLSRDLLKFWDIRQSSLKPTRTQKKIKSDFITFDWNSTQTSFTVLTKQNTISQYDLRTNNAIKSVKSPIQISDITWDKGDNVLFCGGGDSTSGSLMLFTKNLQPISDVFSLHCSRINSLAISPNNKTLASSGQDSLMQIYSLPDILCERSYSASQINYKKVEFNYNGRYLAAGSQQCCIDIYNAAEGGVGHQIKCSMVQQTLSWHPSQMILCYIDEDQKRKATSDKVQESFIRLFSIV